MVSSKTRHQQLSAVAVLSILATAPVAAQDQTVDTDRTTPIVSSTDGGANGGTITIAEGGSVVIGSGTAVTIDSPHNFIMEPTTSISTTDLASGRGLLLDASTEQLISDIEIGGAISVGDATDDSFDFDTATDNIGLLLDGDFGLDGDITITSDGSITASGGDARGIYLGGPMNGDLTVNGIAQTNGNRAIAIDLDGPLTGDFTLAGAVNAIDAGTVGVRVGDTLDGAFIHRGTINVGQTATTDGDDTLDAVPAVAGLLVEADVTGGILLDGIGAENELDIDGDGNDDITDSSIVSFGGGPGVLIRSAEGATTGLTIGEVDGLGYGFVQRGNVISSGESAGVGATGIRIEGTQAAPTNITGGILMDQGVVTARSIDADSIGIDIADYASVPTFVNNGSIDVDTLKTSETDDQGTTDTADDVVTFGPGGEAIGLLIREQASLTSIENNALIAAFSRGEGQDAIAVRDLSGTLSSFTNTGSMGATVDDTNANTIAFDVSVNTSGVTFENSGVVVGDIRFGAGNDTAAFSDGQVIGDIYFGAGNDQLNLSGDASFEGSISFDGTVELNVDGADLELGDTDTLHVSSANFTNGANLIFNVDPNDNEAGVFNIDGAITATEDVNIQPIFSSFSDETQSFQLISAGSIDFADSDASLALSNTPYFFNVDLAAISNGVTGSTVTLNVSPKTAEELDVSPSLTALYENMSNTGFQMDSQFESSLAGLVSKEEAEAALTSILPDNTNASFNAAMIAERQFANHLSNRLTDFMFEEVFEGGAWVREVTTFGDHETSNGLLASDVLSVGLTLGYDKPISENFAWGVNTGFTLNGFSGKDTTIKAELSTFAPFLSVYTLSRFGPVYLGAQATGQYVDIERERTIQFGSVARIVDSSNRAWNFVGTAEAGLDLELGGLRLAPFGRISAQKYSENGYTENGGDSANLTIGKRSFNRTQASFGASLGYDFKWKRPRETKIFRPEIFYSYAKTISGSDPAALDAIFVAGDTSFALEIDQMAERIEQYGGAFNLFGDGSKARVHYAYEKLDDIIAHAVSVNFALTF